MIKYLNNLKHQLNHQPIVSSLHCSVSRVLRNLPIATDFLAEPSIAKASRVPQTSSSFGSRGDPRSETLYGNRLSTSSLFNSSEWK